MVNPISSPPLPEDDGPYDDRTQIGDAVSSVRSTRPETSHLFVLSGKSVGQMFRVEQPELIIGRAADADIRLRDDGVSRRHARVYVEPDGLYVEDLESANGTRVNGHRVHRAILRDGDKFQVGVTTILKFTYASEVVEPFQQKMQEAALHDELTKAYSKTHFLHRLQGEVAYSKRHRAPLSLLMLNVDHLKRINDSHGHAAGDDVLARLAEVVQCSLRLEDLFARFSGERFAILCRGTTANDALTLAERLRATIGAAGFNHQGRRIPVTVSIGVAQLFDQPDSTAHLIADADEALYKAKERGRNRVVVRAFR